MCLPMSKCCFCMSLDVGSKIISILNLISSVVIVMVYGTAALMHSDIAETRKIVYASVAAAAMFQLIVGCLLIYGVFGKKPWFILPWLVTNWIFCILLVALGVIGTILIALQYTSGKEMTNEVSAMASFYCIYGVVIYYFVSIINSRRNKILRENSEESAHRLMKLYFTNKGTA